MRPADWLAREVLVTVGTGGVGKTTVAAALGLEAARRGRRALVITIDPARRLADALDVGELGHEPREVPSEVLARVGIEGDGELHAMMLDTKRAFDEVVEGLAPDRDVYERIHANPIYRNLSDALAGSREYSAMDKLARLHAQGDWDLIVVDTPPATHALDFLDAPRRLTAFLDSSMLRALAQPAMLAGRMGLRFLRSGAELVLGAIQRVTGFEFLSALSEFVVGFEGLFGGIDERAREVAALLRSERCGFVLVAGAEPQQVRRASTFWARLQEEQVPLVGVIVNRMRGWPAGEAPDPDASIETARAWLHDALGASSEHADAILAIARRHAALARRDARLAEQLADALGASSGPVRHVPLLDQDVAALAALDRIAAHVFERPAPAGAGPAEQLLAAGQPWKT